MAAIKIEGVGCFLPGPKIMNDVIASKFGLDSEWIELFVGTKSRHFSMNLDTGEVNFSLADICTNAAKAAIDKAGIDPEGIDALVLATATPDNLMPATVNLVMENLGLNNKETYQLQSGCSGAVQALKLGCNLIASGSKSMVLVMAGDVCNKFIDLEIDFKKLKPSEIVNYALFGDGAGAVILSRDVASSGLKIENILLNCVGNGIPSAQIINWRSNKKDDNQPIFEDYKAIEKRVPVLAKEVQTELLALSSWNVDTINYLLPPQLSKIMTDIISQHLDMPHSNVINCVEDTGNNGNALLFLQLEILANRIKPGEKAIAVAIESSKWIKSGVSLYA